MNLRLAFILLSLTLIVPITTAAQTKKSRVKYGNNPAAGHTFTYDGIQFYYETYGTGEPLLLIHGNGGSIADFVLQIPHFRKRYKVIAMDSRSQGKSGDSPVAITYEMMADDQAALLDHLKLGPVNVVGWSDGGIEALLLGIRHPTKVKKIVSMAANLNPTEDAFRPEALELLKSMGAQAPKTETKESRRETAMIKLILEQPQIELTALEAIKVPTLIMAGDHDVIRDEHTVAIYLHIPNSQLAILPNSTHMVAFDDPMLFNGTVERFLSQPFVKKDRIADVFKSLEKLRAKAAIIALLIVMNITVSLPRSH